MWTSVKEYKKTIMTMLNGDHSARNITKISAALRDNDSHVQG
jgi:hypothetical protein